MLHETAVEVDNLVKKVGKRVRVPVSWFTHYILLDIHHLAVVTLSNVIVMVGSLLALDHCRDE